MLKLLKYEWKACARTCLPLYGAVIFISFINSLMISDAASRIFYGIPTAITTMLNFGVMVAVFVVTSVILIQRFYKNLLGDEGYLMFTLPVTVTQHIVSKMLVAAAMGILSVMAAYLSIGITANGIGTFGWLARSIGALLEYIVEDSNLMLLALELLVLVLVGSVSSALFVYLCISMGHLAKRHRILMSIVWYFVFTTTVQFVSMFIFTTMQDTFLETLIDIVTMNPYGATHLAMLVLILISVAEGVICFFGVRYILKNKLNLE